MIKNVIFDLGRVIFSYEPFDYLKSLGYDEEKAKDIMELVFDSKEWREIDRGTYDFDEALKIFDKKRPDLTEDIKKTLHDNWWDILDVMEESLAFYNKLKQDGYKIYILSNFSEKGFKYVYSKFDFFKLADGMVISSHVKLNKPEPEIYNLILSKYSLVPSETVFIDDVLENIVAAENAGINGILFTGINDVIKKFEVIRG